MSIGFAAAGKLLSPHQTLQKTWLFSESKKENKLGCCSEIVSPLAQMNPSILWVPQFSGLSVLLLHTMGERVALLGGVALLKESILVWFVFYRKYRRVNYSIGLCYLPIAG